MNYYTVVIFLLGLLSFGTASWFVFAIVSDVRIRSMSHSRDDSGSPLPPRDAPLRVFMAVQMTSVSEPEYQRLAETAGYVTRILQQEGVQVVSAIPQLLRLARNRGNLGDAERRILAESDAAVILASGGRPEGFVIARAAAAGASVLALGFAGAPEVAAMAAGLAGVTSVNIGAVADIGRLVGEWLQDVRPAMEQRRYERAILAESIARELPEVRRLMHSLSTAELESANLDRRRLLALVAHPSILASASLAEVMTLQAVLGRNDIVARMLTPNVGKMGQSVTPTLRESSGISKSDTAVSEVLTSDKWSALIAAALLNDWDDLHLATMVERFFETSESVTARSSSFKTTQDWIGLYSATFEDV